MNFPSPKFLFKAIAQFVFFLLFLVPCHASTPEDMIKKIQEAQTDDQRFEALLIYATYCHENYRFQPADSIYEMVQAEAKMQNNWKPYIRALSLQEDSKLKHGFTGKATELGDEAIRLSVAHGLIEEEFHARSRHSVTLDFLGKTQQGESELKKVNAILENFQPDPISLGELYANASGIYLSLGQDDTAKTLLSQAMAIFEKEKDWTRYASMLDLMGIQWSYSGELDSTKAYYLRSIRMLREKGLDTPANLFDPVFNLFSLVTYQRNMDTATYLGKEAMQLAEQLNTPMEQAIVYKKQSQLYAISNDLEQAKWSAKKAVDLLKTLDSPVELASAYRGYAQKLAYLGENEEALEVLEMSQELSGSNPDEKPYDYCSYLENRGAILKRLDRIEQAIRAFREGLQVATRQKIPQYQMRFVQSISSLLSKEERYDSARVYALKTLDLAKETGLRGGELDAYRILISAEENTQNFQKALAYSQALMVLKDSMYEEKYAKALSQERISQNLDDAEEKKEAAEANAALLASRNNLFAGLIAALAIILLGGGYFFFRLRQSSRKISSQNEELTQLNQTKDRFFGIIAHDLRSPLVAFEGLGKQINHYLRKESFEKIQLLGGRVDEVSHRLNGLLDNLLNWALLQTGTIPYHPQKINFDDVVQDIFDVFQHNASAKRIDMVSEVDASLYVFADENSLNAILRNLLANALKFTPEGGKVVIGTENKNGKAYISVNDNGTGISAEKMEKLFSMEQKSTAGTSGEKGTGLGLILTRDLVKLNQGGLDIKSTVGKGSSFIFDLPLAT